MAQSPVATIRAMTLDLYHMHFDAGVSPDALFAAHVAYGRQFPEAPRPPRKPGAKIRVGYVSDDFYSHAAAYFLLPLLDTHDRDRFEIFLYSKTKKTDVVTGWFKQRGHWRDLSTDDGEAFGSIQADGIDILVGCSGHTPGNSLSLFARRQAPVSVTFLGLSQYDRAHANRLPPDRQRHGPGRRPGHGTASKTTPRHPHL